MPAEFTVVPREAPPAPPAPAPAPDAPPRRPVALAVVAVGMMVLAVPTLLFGAALTTASLFSEATDANPTYGGFAAFIALLGLLLMVMEGFTLFVAWRLWNGENWARFAALALIALWVLNPAVLVGSVEAAAEPERLVGMAGVLVVGAAAAYALLMPASAAYCAAAARQPRTHGEPAGVRVVAWLLGAIAAYVLVALALFPARSLMTTADGATLAQDAALLFLPAAGLAATGAWLATRTPHRLPAAVAGVAGAGIVAALLMLHASEAAREPLLDGRATGGEGARILLGLLAAAGVLTHAALLLALRDAKAATFPAAAAACLAFGVGMLAANAWTMAQADQLQTHAAARERHNTPGLGTLILLATLALTALAMRRQRRE